MGTDLRNALRSLCLDSTWQYAVFWKLEYRSRLLLTWEDAYYDNCGQPDSLENRSCIEKCEHFLGGNSQNDQLGLSVAEMSYHVYSLGEGVVGQVAATGKHRWIIADNFLSNSFSSLEFSDGWQSQFLAGIRTIVVVAVVPHGVVQLGSLNKVIEDMEFIGHVREVFLTLQDSLFGSCMKSSFLLNTTVEAANKHEMIVSPTPGTDDSENWLRSNDLYLEKQKQVMMDLITSQFFEGECTLLKDRDRAAKCGFISPSSASIKKSLDSLPGSSQKFGTDLANPSVNLLDASVCDGVSSYQSSVLKNSESSGLIVGEDLGNMLAYEAQTSYLDGSNMFTMFSAGHELLEALEPPFFKSSMYYDCEQEKTEAESVVEMPEVLTSSEMVFDTGSECLLEAVVSSACQSGSDVVSEKSACNSVRSMPPSEKLSEPPNWSKVISQTSCSFKHSFAKDDARDCSNSTGVCGAFSSIGFSPTSMSACSERLDRHSEPAKNNKKRARPGESCRPRPRDRQLIQDRIKELRELVPNGAKCSIDSLLERTMKHMLFLESITKHADKLNQCAESKMHQKGMSTSNCDQGSSWAVEVGGHLKVSSIVVENLNKDGQMLVGMMCEECSHFLEIAEAIRGLGLTILKGVTEVQGDKTWICFIVEGQNSRIMHRMDILWLLVPVLQPKTPSPS